MSEPRPGYRSTVMIEMVDPSGQRMSDVTINWYGFEGKASEAEHNAIQTNVIRAIVDEVQRWIPEKLKRPEPEKKAL